MRTHTRRHVAVLFSVSIVLSVLLSGVAGAGVAPPPGDQLLSGDDHPLRSTADDWNRFGATPPSDDSEPSANVTPTETPTNETPTETPEPSTTETPNDPESPTTETPSDSETPTDEPPTNETPTETPEPPTNETPTETPEPPTNETTTDEPSDAPVPVIIGFEDDTNATVLATYAVSVTHEFELVSAVAADVPPATIDMLERSPQVAYVERDTRVRTPVTDVRSTSSKAGRVTVPARSDSDAVRNETDAPEGRVEESGQRVPWGVSRVLAPEATAASGDGEGVVVAIVDTGVNYTHPDLQENYAGGYDFVNDDDEPLDDAGHGTHVAGTIAASDNDVGVLGTAPGSDYYAVKVLGRNGAGYLSDVVAGVEWAVEGPDGDVGTDDDAQIISMSLGTSVDSIALREAVDNAADEGVLVVAAAGNSGTFRGENDTVLYPARYDSTVAVGAVDWTNSRPFWSSTGPDVELTAPGVLINSTLPGGEYGRLSGTSMATPHVSGVAALVFDSPVVPAFDEDDDGAWDASEVRARLADSAIDLQDPGRDTWSGHGLVAATTAVGTDITDVATTDVLVPETVVSGDVVPVVALVENQGSSAESTSLALVDESSGQTLENQTVTLNATEEKSVTLQWQTADVTPGRYNVSVVLRPLPNETDTDDNSRVSQVLVRESRRDLAVDDLSAPDTVDANGTATVSVRISSHGTTSEWSTLRLVADANTTSESDDATVGVVSLRLPPGGSGTVAFDWAPNESSDTWRFVARVDAAPNETNTTNNERERLIAVAPGSESDSDSDSDDGSTPTNGSEPTPTNASEPTPTNASSSMTPLGIDTLGGVTIADGNRYRSAWAPAVGTAVRPGR